MRLKEVGVIDVLEVKEPEAENYKRIKPESDITPVEAWEYLDGIFENVKDSESNISEQNDSSENVIEKTVREYIQDLKSKSEFSDTISGRLSDASDMKKISPEENEKMREEFYTQKEELIQQWETKTGCTWPVYKQDVLSKDGKVIRIAGMRYDCHHIIPLCMGGKNEVDNITPLHADVHYDRQGVHASDGPLNKLMSMIGDK